MYSLEVYYIYISISKNQDIEDEFLNFTNKKKINKKKKIIIINSHKYLYDLYIIIILFITIIIHEF